MKITSNSICHITSVHSRYDTRIFIKMCSSFANCGYIVSLIVADGKGDELINGIQIYDIGIRAKKRIHRMMSTVNKLFQKAASLNCDLYHLHDPELLPLVSKIKRMGKKVIFDAHEDLPKQILSKPYLNRFSAVIISSAVKLYEKLVCSKPDFIITATPSIRNKFQIINKNTLDVNNYPLLDELYSEEEWSNKKEEICFVGGISRIRGIKELVKALEFYNGCLLNLAGEFSDTDLKNELQLLSGWKYVQALGYQNRQEVKVILAKSKAGIVTFLPVDNHISSQPNKMFEYMSAGLPVISSDFPLWKEIVEGNNCGICVNPENPEEIAMAIRRIIEDRALAKKMGENGRKAVSDKYNWTIEEKKLLMIYKQVLQV